MSCNRGNRFAGVFILTFAFLLMFLSSGFSQTADDYFEQGKAALVNNSLSEAHAKFQAALSLNPNHEGANFFYALTNILMISTSSNLNSLLDRAGVSATGRNIFEWEADFARDAHGNVILPSDTPTGAELQGFAKNDVLPAIVVSLDHLGKVGSGFQTYFNWTEATGEGSVSGLKTFTTSTDYWYPNEWAGYKLLVAGSVYDIISNTSNVLTVSSNLSVPPGTQAYKIVAPVEIDYGDVLVVRGGLTLAKAGIQIFSAYNFNVDIDSIVSLIYTPDFDIQTDIIQAYPQLLTLLPANQLAEAKANVREAIAQLTAAVNFILAEVDPQGNDWFVISSGEAAKFSSGLQEWNSALDGPAFITSMETQVDLTQFFDHPKNLRSFLPTFNGTLIKRGSLPDPTFGGIFPTLTAADVYRLLDEAGLLAPGDGTDLDGDTKTDLTVWRASTGTWYTLLSGSPGSFTSTRWGMPGDVVVPGDYSGDGKDDFVVWRPSTGVWYLLAGNWGGGYWSFRWGISSDVPVPGDYDGDKCDDFAVWRPALGVWYVNPWGLPSDYKATPWGMNGDIPVPADYDGDRKTDIAVWRPGTGTWYILPSNSPGTYRSIQWGIASDVPTPGDYDGDGKADVAVWRPDTGVWFIMPSASPGTYTATAWGLASDTPVSGDYDGDGRTDVAVWRSSTGYWYILPSNSPTTYTATRWGMAGDVPFSSLTVIVGRTH